MTNTPPSPSHRPSSYEPPVRVHRLLSALPLLQLTTTAAAATLTFLRPQLGPLPLLLLALPPLLLRFILPGRLSRRALLTPYFLPLLLFLASAAAARWSAYDPIAAQNKFWLIIAAILLFYAIAHYNLQPPAVRGTISSLLTPANGLILFGLAIALYFIAANDWDAQPAKIDILTRIGRLLQTPLPTIPGERLHPNVVAGILTLTIPFTLHPLSPSPLHPPSSIVHRLLLLIPLPITATALLLTTSRGAWLALAAALLLAALWPITRRLAPHFRLSPRALYTFLLLLLAALALVAIILFPNLPIAALDRLPGPSGIRRLDLYRNALILAIDYPLIGAGLDNFSMLYSTYSLLLHVPFLPHAHNLLLDLSIQQGLLAPLTLLLLTTTALAILYTHHTPHASRHTHHATRITPHPFTTPAAIALTTLLLHGLVDDPIYASRALPLLFTPLAFILPTQPPSIAHRPSSTVLITTLLLATLATLTLVHRPSSAVPLSNLAAIQQHKLELAAYHFPQHPIQDHVRRQIDLSTPIAAYQRALQRDPLNPTANRRLGQIYLSLAQYDRARQHLLLAHQVTPWDHATRQLLGEAHITTGHPQQGAALWADLPNTLGQLNARAAWYRQIGDAERFRLIESIARQSTAR